jgi:hypothetical protein
MANWSWKVSAVSQDQQNFNLVVIVVFTSDDPTPRSATRTCSGTDLTIDRVATWAQNFINNVLKPSDDGLTALQAAVGQSNLPADATVAARKQEKVAFDAILQAADAVTTLKQAEVDPTNPAMVFATAQLNDAVTAHAAASDALSVIDADYAESIATAQPAPATLSPTS